MTKYHKFEYVGPEMENLRHKKNTCEEKKYFPAKTAPAMHLKNVGFTYKCQILKFKTQQKV